MTYDLINDLHSWKATGTKYSKVNPNRLWFQWWKPKHIDMEVLEKVNGNIKSYVGYYNDGSTVVAESILFYSTEDACTRS